jgi:hypothetical protein
MFRRDSISFDKNQWITNFIYRANTEYYDISSHLNWNPNTVCEKGCWNDQIHNDNTTRMTKYKFIIYQAVQKLLVGDRQTGDLTSLLSFLESKLQKRIVSRTGRTNTRTK